MKRNLKIKTLDETIKTLYLGHEKNYVDDAGYDLFVPFDIIIQPNEVFKIDHQIQCEMEEYLPTIRAGRMQGEFKENCSYFLVPRSSITKKTLLMVNSIGIIDASYRGNIIAVVYNFGNKPVEIKKGERLFQIIFPTLVPFTVELVDILSETERNDGGFGSTGN